MRSFCPPVSYSRAHKMPETLIKITCEERSKAMSWCWLFSFVSVSSCHAAALTLSSRRACPISFRPITTNTAWLYCWLPLNPEENHESWGGDSVQLQHGQKIIFFNLCSCLKSQLAYSTLGTGEKPASMGVWEFGHSRTTTPSKHNSTEKIPLQNHLLFVQKSVAC